PLAPVSTSPGCRPPTAPAPIGCRLATELDRDTSAEARVPRPKRVRHARPEQVAVLVARKVAPRQAMRRDPDPPTPTEHVLASRVASDAANRRTARVLATLAPQPAARTGTEHQ